MKAPIVETIAIGDELLTGKTSDTNSTFVASELFKRGLRIENISVIPDKDSVILETIRGRVGAGKILVCFGGLGPTSDDRTASCIGTLLSSSLIEHAPSRKNLEARYERLGRTVNPAALKQVLYPEKTSPISNKVGLAPGFRFDLNGARLFFLPGVPAEMKDMFIDGVLPEILRGLTKEILKSQTWNLLSIPESALQTLMNPVEENLPKEIWLGYRTDFPENHLTLYSKEGEPAVFESLKEKIGRLVTPYCYGMGTETLEEIVVGKLKDKQLTVSFAESCTGGLALQRLTRVGGASQVVWGGASVYSNEAKRAFLDVNPDKTNGSVSAECTKALAVAIQEKSGADFGGAVTGFLSPAPGEEEGRIYLCVSGRGRVEERTLLLHPRSRFESQWGASAYLLETLLKCLK